jgi:hypothetical protein
LAKRSKARKPARKAAKNNATAKKGKTVKRKSAAGQAT